MTFLCGKSLTKVATSFKSKLEAEMNFLILKSKCLKDPYFQELRGMWNRETPSNEIPRKKPSSLK